LRRQGRNWLPPQPRRALSAEENAMKQVYIAVANARRAADGLAGPTREC